MNHLQKRLAFFVPSMRGGGAERSLLKLAQSIAERGYSVDLLLAQVEGPYLAEVPNSVRIVDLKAPRVLTGLPRLVRYLRRERPDAMLSALNHANIVALWARWLAGNPTRLVVSERSALSACAGNSTKRRGQLMPKLIRCFYPWADEIVAVSEGVADDLAAATRLPRDRIQAIYNPIVTPEFQQKVQQPLEHPWFEPGQPPVILAVGRLRPQKDFPTLIRAFARIRQRHSARLLILGEGSERPALESLVEELGLADDVSLPGFAANPYPYMTRAAVFVLCSRWEGLPGALIEALYCGVPLVSTDCPSGPQEILKGGQYGQLVPVGDVDALSQALERVLVDRSPTPPPESWKPFEQEGVVDRYLELLVGC